MIILADSISFAVLFLFIYSIVNIFSNFIVSNISNTSLKIFDKNFGILFGFFRALLIFSLINIILNWVVWKKSTPEWVNDSKAMLLINYTSNKFIKVLPKRGIKKIEETFNISLDNKIEGFINNKNKLDKYNEPAIKLKKNNKGYSDSDNDLLDKLFNIESNN